MSGSRRNTPTVHKARKSLGDVRSEINVTPLVDVCLVLLIIFMVVSDKLVRGVEVPLPKTRHHVEKNDTGEDYIVSIDKDGGRVLVFWDRDNLPRGVAELKERTEKALRGKKRAIFIKADENLAYKDVYPVLVALHEAGAIDINLGVAKLKDKE